ncbi:MAG TPA: hypothetical protein VMW24_24570 [Sedimentisphaerales bacterium]|nr:hypothetical protein [Sedimentisphaerales bacterium]
MTRPVQQIEAITEDLRKVKLKIELLCQAERLSRAQKKAVESLQWSLDGVRGWELGVARQAFGLDGHLIDITNEIKTGGSRRKAWKP